VVVRRKIDPDDWYGHEEPPVWPLVAVVLLMLASMGVMALSMPDQAAWPEER